ncbi:MAG: metal ABC transporter solute-binding protein, Zn/Mn family [Paracoccaceae bacterium]
MAASIPPVAALVQQIAGDTGTPALLFDGGGSVHGASLLPSQIRTLRRADLLVRIGSTAEPWLDRVEIAPQVPVLVLSQVPGTTVLPAREHGVFAGHDHEGEDAGEDPHMWLDPENVGLWLKAVAGALSRADPENTGIYKANLATALAQLEQTEKDIARRMKALDGITPIYAHDAFLYFEQRFGMSAEGSLTGTRGIAPGAASVARLNRAGKGDRVCVIHDATHSEAMAVNLFPRARHVTIDPMGAGVPRDGTWISAFFQGIAVGFEKCADAKAG